MSDLFTDEMLAELEELRKETRKAREQAEIGVVVEDGDAGVSGKVSKDVGKPGGWEVVAEGGWMRRTGARLAALLSWKGK